jgi:hypothetical protein
MSSKCQFKVMTVGYLGYLISFDSVAIDLTKIQSVQTWPVSTSPKGVRGFLGLAGYYRKFVRGFGVIVAPLTKLLTNKGFHWTEESLLAFNQLKYALTSPPVLRLLDFTQ